jgi:thioester reductase-like protein
MLANLANGDKESAEDAQAKDYDYSAINRVLEGNCMQAFRQGEREALGNVLVTGTTGYLGIHILKELIASDVRQIYCLVRGNSITTAKQRLKTLLFYYFSEDYAHLFDERINIVLGDVTQPIDEDLPVDTIFNCAAVVKHFAEGTFIEDVNIGGAKHCVDFCLKKQARFIHISTASTRGLSVNGIPASNEVFSEKSLYMGQFLGNKYIHSKFVAERLILDAVATKGLRAKIMRVGNLSARSTDGEFQINFSTNSFMGRIRVYNMLGCFPHDLRTSPVEFSPIDEVARAIILLSQTPKECCVFHPYNIHTQFMGDVLKVLEPITRGIEFVEMEEFENAMEQAKNDPAKAQILASLLAYENMAHGQKTSDVKRSNDYTTQVLFRLGFSWSTTSMDYVERMLKAIAGLGFFDV